MRLTLKHAIAAIILVLRFATPVGQARWRMQTLQLRDATMRPPCGLFAL